jgi:hypothetical protein
LLFLCFFTTFFFPSTLASHYERIARYTTILNDERRVTHHPVVLPIFVLPWLTLAFFITIPFFLSRSIAMATDIGSLATGHDEK